MSMDDGGSFTSHSVFTFCLTDPGGGTISSFKVMQFKDKLFINISHLVNYSKECIVSLLDYAETSLKCTTVYCVISNNMSDEHKKIVIRSFRFMDFKMSCLDHPLKCTGYIFMSYAIEVDEDED
jgi:predicted cation transporter